MPALLTKPGPQKHAAKDDGDFVVFENVPVFDEHVGEHNGEPCNYNRKILEAIAKNCNDRIDDTGDWCPIVVGHTPDPDSDRGQPEIIGYAGPFKVSVIGNKRQRACIIADFRIFADKADVYRQNPRRSVELWPEARPEDAFFDPIAVLGAETPRRSLGLVYQRSRPGKRPVKYEMAATAPGGSNTFIPDFEPDKHAMTDTNDIAADFAGQNVTQLAEALKPMIQAIVAESMSAINDNQIPDEDIHRADAAMQPEMDAPVEPEPPVADQPEELPPMDDAPAEVPAPTAGDEPSLFSKYFKQKLSKCLEDEEMDEHNKLDYMKQCYEKLDDDERDEAMGLLDGDEADDEDRKALYAKAKYMLMGDAEDDEESDTPAMKFRKSQHRELAQKYAKAQKQLDESRRKERYAKRLSTLQDLESQGFVLDPANEMEFAGPLSDTAFDAFTDRVKQRYQRVNTGSIARQAVAPQRKPASGNTADDLAPQAEAIVTKARKEGKSLNYSKVLSNLVANKGQYVEAG